MFELICNSFKAKLIFCCYKKKNTGYCLLDINYAQSTMIRHLYTGSINLATMIEHLLYARYQAMLKKQGWAGETG